MGKFMGVIKSFSPLKFKFGLDFFMPMSTIIYVLLLAIPVRSSDGDIDRTSNYFGYYSNMLWCLDTRIASSIDGFDYSHLSDNDNKGGAHALVKTAGSLAKITARFPNGIVREVELNISYKNIPILKVDPSTGNKVVDKFIFAYGLSKYNIYIAVIDEVGPVGYSMISYTDNSFPLFKAYFSKIESCFDANLD